MLHTVGIGISLPSTSSHACHGKSAQALSIMSFAPSFAYRNLLTNCISILAIRLTIKYYNLAVVFMLLKHMLSKAALIPKFYTFFNIKQIISFIYTKSVQKAHIQKTGTYAKDHEHNIKASLSSYL